MNVQQSAGLVMMMVPILYLSQNSYDKYIFMIGLVMFLMFSDKRK